MIQRKVPDNDSQVIHIGNPEALIIRTIKELNNE